MNAPFDPGLRRARHLAEQVALAYDRIAPTWPVQLPVTDAARAIVADALRAGNGARDIAALHLRYGDADDAPVD